MPTTRETILQALHVLLQTQPASVLRGDVLPERVPAAGLLILCDGDPGEPSVTLSPLRYHYQHRAEIEAIVQTTGRDAAFDALSAGAARDGVHAGSTRYCVSRSPSRANWSRRGVGAPRSSPPP